MNEEMKNEVINEEEVAVVENNVEPNYSEESGVLGKLIVGAMVVVGAGVATLAYKNRVKLEERSIKRLEKKGYVVYKADDVEIENVYKDITEGLDE